MDQRLGIYHYPAGIVYADRHTEEDGDYKDLAFLCYGELKLSFKKEVPTALRFQILEHAKELQSRKGESFKTSTCGSSVKLGGAIPPSGG